MNQMLDEFRAKIEARVTTLLKDIEDVTIILDGYQSELRPLLPILKAMDSPLYTKVRVSMGGPLRTRQEPEAAPEPGTPQVSDPPQEKTPQVKAPESPSWRWSQYKLPPRHMRFLTKFGDKASFTWAEAENWYKTEINPTIQYNSLRAGVNIILHCLTQKKIITKQGDGWQFIR